MQPADIKGLLPMADVWPHVSAAGCEDEMRDFLIGLLINDQMWGSVVEETSSKNMLCFGSAIFIDDDLSTELLDKKRPYLLLDLCRDRSLRRHILTYRQVQSVSSSEKNGLNFVGVLFKWAPLYTIKGGSFMQNMDELQRLLRLLMSGFNIKQYFKCTYASYWFEMKWQDVAMRKSFGANNHTEFDHRDDSSVQQYRPVLFEISRDAAERDPGTKASDLLVHGMPTFKWGRETRMFLRCQLEQMTDSEIKNAMGLSSKTPMHDKWKLVEEAVKKNPELSEMVDQMMVDRTMRKVMIDLVGRNLHELGVLPQLLEAEKSEWKTIKGTETDQERSLGEASTELNPETST